MRLPGSRFASSGRGGVEVWRRRRGGRGRGCVCAGAWKVSRVGCEDGCSEGRGRGGGRGGGGRGEAPVGV
eukprot:208151-Rhodomonas_salina.1